MMTRRAILKNTGVTAFGFGAAPAWLTKAAFASAAQPKQVLVVVFQRGAMDGLNAVIPFAEKNYAALRPTIAMPPPARGEAASPIELDGFFALHPALAPLSPLWKEKTLAVIHATGSPDPTRSHFDAQDFMESGTPGRKSTRDGWLNRAIGPGEKTSPVRAVSMGGTLAKTLRGPNAAVAVNDIGRFTVRGPSNGEFQSMYSRTEDAVLQGAGRDTFEAMKLLESIGKGPGGADYPRSRLGRGLEQIARIVKAGVGMEVAFVDSLGWDTHVGQAPALNNLLGDLARSIAAFHADLGSRMSNVTIVTMSEFGRTARENGNRGTDHGHANVMLTMGAGISGGKVYGRWPGLEQEQLHDGRDLAVTTDFRDVLGSVVTARLGVRDVTKVFPGHQYRPLSGLAG